MTTQSFWNPLCDDHGLDIAPPVLHGPAVTHGVNNGRINAVYQPFPPIWLEWQTAGRCRVAGLQDLSVGELTTLFGRPFRCARNDLYGSNGQTTCWWTIYDLEADVSFAIRNHFSDPDTSSDWSIALVTAWKTKKCFSRFRANLAVAFGRHLTD